MLTKTISWIRPEYSPLAFTPTSIKINARPFFFYSAIVMELLLVANIIWSCSSTFDCRSFWPTISYIACFRGHDRLFNFSTGYFMVILLLFFCLASVQFSDSCSVWKNRLMLLLGIGISFLLPSASILDEANSSHIVPLEKVHLILMVIMISAGILWIYFSMKIMNALKLPKREEEWRDFLVRYLVFGHAMTAFTIVEWVYAYTTYKNWWMNENVEALCEWTVVTMCVFGPFVYSLTFPSCSLAIASKEEEVEGQ